MLKLNHGAIVAMLKYLQFDPSQIWCAAETHSAQIHRLKRLSVRGLVLTTGERRRGRLSFMKTNQNCRAAGFLTADRDVTGSAGRQIAPGEPGRAVAPDQ